MQRVTGIVQHYAWGDTTFIPELLGRPLDGRPWAELWLGTHPNGPIDAGRRAPAERHHGRAAVPAEGAVGGATALAADPPERRAGRRGFRARRYADPRPKPELLCALTQFEALCGVRPIHLTLPLLGELGAHDLRRVVATSGPAAALEGLLRGGDRPVAGDRGVRRLRPHRGALGALARRAVPRRAERRRHAAAQPRGARTRAGASGSTPATCTPTCAGRASS